MISQSECFVQSLWSHLREFGQSEWLHDLRADRIFYRDDYEQRLTLKELARKAEDAEDLADVPIHAACEGRVFLTIEDAIDADGFLRPWATALLDEIGLGAALVECATPRDARVWGCLNSTYDTVEGAYAFDGRVVHVAHRATNVSATVARGGTLNANAYAAVDALARKAGVRRPLGADHLPIALQTLPREVRDVRMWTCRGALYSAAELHAAALAGAIEPDEPIGFRSPGDVEFEDDGWEVVEGITAPRVALIEVETQRGEMRYYLSRCNANHYLFDRLYGALDEDENLRFRFRWRDAVERLPAKPIVELSRDPTTGLLRNVLTNFGRRLLDMNEDELRADLKRRTDTQRQIDRNRLVAKAVRVPELFEDANAEAVSGLVDGWISADGRTVVLGAPKVGKTTLLMGLAGAVAGGLPEFLGQQVHGQANVLFVSTEQRLPELRKLAEKVCHGLGIDARALVAERKLCIVSTLEPPLGFPETFYTPDDREALAALAAAMSAGVVVVDTVGEAVVEGDARNYGNMRTALSELDKAVARAGAQLVVSQHPTKQADGRLWLSPTDAQGSGLYEYSKTFVCVGARRNGRCNVLLRRNGGPDIKHRVEFGYEDAEITLSRAGLREPAERAEPPDEPPAAVSEPVARPEPPQTPRPAPDIDWSGAPPHAREAFEFVESRPGERFTAWDIADALGGMRALYPAAVRWLVDRKLVRRLRQTAGERKALRVGARR